MSVRMPEPDAEILGRRDRIVTALRSIVPGEGVIASAREISGAKTIRMMTPSTRSNTRLPWYAAGCDTTASLGMCSS